MMTPAASGAPLSSGRKPREGGGGAKGKVFRSAKIDVEPWRIVEEKEWSQLLESVQLLFEEGRVVVVKTLMLRGGADLDNV